MGRLTPPAPLAADHDLEPFACGVANLDDWLKRRARKSDGETARTYVVCAGRRAVGYYCLAAGAIVRQTLPNAKLRRNAPDQVPVAVVGRLAVDLGYRGRQIGGGLLKDALLRAIQASRLVGIRAVLIHALDDEAAAFYARYGFLAAPFDGRTLVMPIETAVAALG